MLGDLGSARKSLHASLEVLDPERGNIRNLSNKGLRKRLTQLRRFDLAATMPRSGGSIESKEDLLQMELGTTYELLSQIALGEQQHVKAEYHGLCAASFGMHLKTLQPLVPRALLCQGHLSPRRAFPCFRGGRGWVPGARPGRRGGLDQRDG